MKATLALATIASLLIQGDLRSQGPAARPMVLLITAPELAVAWQPFAAWKTSIGKPTRIVTTDSIAEQFPHEDLRESIRLCVRKHIDDHGTRWVVIGGDSLPGGDDREDWGLVPGGHTTYHQQERQGIPTDIVYLSPTSWDGDGDGRHGEWQDDKDAITYPDGSVGLGRIPVRTKADVQAFTAKVIEYESAYPEDAFATHMVYTCTDSPAYPKVRRSWDEYVSAAWHGEVARFFSQETPWDDAGQPGSHPLNAANLSSLINGKTTGKMHIHGHGMLPFWVLEDDRFTTEDAAALRNKGAYPLITTVSCFTGQYDSANDPSIVEAVLRQPAGGSVAVVAPVRTGKPHFHNRSDFRLMVQEGKLDGTTQTMTRYWSNGLGKNMTTGEALMHAKAAMIDDANKTPGYHLCICELNLLGDPTLDMRAAAPRTPSVTVPATIAKGTRTLTVQTDAPGAVVCVHKAGRGEAGRGEAGRGKAGRGDPGRGDPGDKTDEVYVIATTDKQGNAVLELAPTTSGSMTVAISGPSLNAVVKIVEVSDS